MKRRPAKVSNAEPSKAKSSVQGMTLRRKAAILRAHRGAIKSIAEELGYSHTAISRTLDGKHDLNQKWIRERVLPAIDRKVNEILALNSIKDKQLRRKAKDE